MRIRTRILFGYLLLAMVVGIVGLVGYGATNKVGRNFDAAINHTQPVLQALHDIRFLTVQMKADAFRAASAPREHYKMLPLTGDEEHLRFFELDRAVAGYLKQVGLYFPDESDEAAEIAKKIAAFKQIVISAHAEKLSPPEVERLVDEIAVSTTEILQAIDDAAAGELKEFVEYQRGVDREIASQEYLILFTAFMAVLIAILVGFHLSGKIARPLLALNDSARRLGEGHLDSRVDVTDDTEIGELGYAFNSMAEKLAGSMVSRDYVNDIIDSMAEGMIVVDCSGLVERVNQAFCKLYRSDPDHVFSGQPITHYLPDTDALGSPICAPKARQWIESKMTTADGDVRIVALSVASLHSHNVVGPWARSSWCRTLRIANAARRG